MADQDGGASRSNDDRFKVIDDLGTVTSRSGRIRSAPPLDLEQGISRGEHAEAPLFVGDQCSHPGRAQKPGSGRWCLEVRLVAVPSVRDASSLTGIGRTFVRGDIRPTRTKADSPTGHELLTGRCSVAHVKVHASTRNERCLAAADAVRSAADGGRICDAVCRGCRHEARTSDQSRAEASLWGMRRAS